MKYLTITLILLASLLLLTNNTVLAATTIQVRVANGDDDAEEEAGGGDVHFSSSDLELIRESSNQTVGIRFQNVLVPSNATILSAYIEFTVDEDNADDNLDGTLTITGEASDDAPAFIDDVDGAISALDRTSASVEWVLSDENSWTNTGDEKQTPELKTIVQETVYRAGWSSGQNMVFIISGTGKRVAESYNGSSTHAPLLFIEYEEGVASPVISTSPAASLGTSSYEGLNAIDGSFQLTNTGSATLDFTITDDADWFACSANCSGTVDAGQSVTVGVTYSNSTMIVGTHNGHFSITDANASNSPFEYDVILLIQEIPTGSTCGEVPIYAQDMVDPAILVLLDVSSSMNSMMPMASGDDNPTTPDLQSIVQEIVEHEDWASGNSMAFIVTGSGKRVAESYDGVSSAAPLLSVEYTDGGTPGSFEARVIQTNDDAEESAGGAIDLDSSDLELIREGSDQTVGMRFQDVTIPPGAVITNASIEFTIDESSTEETNLIIAGEDTGDASVFEDVTNNISGRTQTTASVNWDITEQWSTPPEKARYVIGREVISELVADDSISWGYGTWAFTSYDGPNSEPDLTLLPANPYGASELGLYTKIWEGIKHRTGAETETLQAVIEATTTTGGTPLGPSLLAAREYYAGNKDDEIGNTYDSTITCQPKFLIDVTDGLGYLDHTSVDIINKYTNLLADEEISSVAVGFGIDNATQIQEMAKIANERGLADNDLYALHEEDADGNGLPFIAQNQEELTAALQAITNSIKTQVFVGSSPAPSTSVNAGTFVINATFNAGNWTGDLGATPYDPVTGALMMCVDSSGNQTCDSAQVYGKCLDAGETTCNTEDIVVGECLCWTASEVMPATKNAWTVDGDVSESGALLPNGGMLAGLYVDDHLNLSNYEIGLDGDNYICRDLGDIIKSTPVIVESPKKPYSFDNYRAFKFGDAKNRDHMLYVGANDGALHAFKLTTGVEDWRFYPEAVHQKLIDTDICAGDFCHEYFVDATSVVADIYKGTSEDEWATMLISGLGRGGDAYFALDITSAESFVENGSDPLTATTYLWQFTDDELGFTMGVPAIARVSSPSATFGGWAAYFGSGYDVAGSSNKEAYVFGIEAYTMTDLWQDENGDPINRIKVEDDVSFSDDALSDPFVADLDFDNFGDYLYTGNLYGKMYRLTNIGKDEEPDVGALFNIHPLEINHNTPIRAGVAVGYDSGPETLWVYFGTGKFEEQADKYNTEQQYFIGVKDYLSDPAPVVSTLSDLLERSTAAVNATFYGEEREYRVMTGRTFLYEGDTLVAGQTMLGVQSGATGVIDSVGTLNGENTVTFQESDISTGTFIMGESIIQESDNSIEATLKNHPWYATLQHTVGVPSERVIAKALVAGGVVFFTSFIPDEDVCGGNGTAWLYGLDYETGLPPADPVFDLDGGGSYDSGDVVTHDGKSYRVAAIPIGRGVPSAPVLEGDMIFVNTTDGAGGGIPVNLPTLKASISAWKDGVF